MFAAGQDSKQNRWSKPLVLTRWDHRRLIFLSTPWGVYAFCWRPHRRLSLASWHPSGGPWSSRRAPYALHRLANSVRCGALSRPLRHEHPGCLCPAHFGPQTIRFPGSRLASFRPLLAASYHRGDLPAVPAGQPMGRVPFGRFLFLFHLAAGAINMGQRDFLLCAFLLLSAHFLALSFERRGCPEWALLAGLLLGAGMSIKPHCALYGIS